MNYPVARRVLVAGLVSLGGLALSASAADQPAAGPPVVTLLRCGKLLDKPGASAAARSNVTVVIKDGRISKIVDGFGVIALDVALATPPTEIDLRDSFVLPGLIDCHVHITHEQAADSRLRGVIETDADETVRGVAYCRKTVEAGFTTVRDLGAGGDSIFALREGIRRGDIVGPRIIAAGKAISVTGGHGDPTNGYDASLVGIPGTDKGVADGPDECMKAVRNQIKRGADVIKLTATGGVLSQSSASLGQHFTDAELAAIVKAAHSMGRKVAAHAHGTDGINAALKAGCDSIEHGSFQDAESIRLFKAKNPARMGGEAESGGWYVPTLLAGKTVTDRAAMPGYYHAFVAKKALEVGPKMLATFREAHKQGVKIAFGTDTGVSPHGENAQEFALMVQGGMTPSEAIMSATVNAAELCGVSEEVSTIEPGKVADLIAVKGDPLKDVTELERVSFVMRAGSVVKK